MPEVVSTEARIGFSLSQIQEAAQTLLKEGKGSTVWAFHGPMGSGKTTLIKAIVHELGSTDTVASPTFSIVNEYRTAQGPVYHFDFYRIKNETEAYDIGANEYFDSGDLCLVEWPEKIPSLIPVPHFEIQIEIIDEKNRLIQYRTHA